MPQAATDRISLYFSPPRPEAWIGALSPLWGYFTGAAMLGVSWWWMTRLLGAPLAPAEPQAQTGVSAVPLGAAPLPAALASQDLPAAPVGGEAAPISPLVAVAPTPAVETAASPAALATAAEPSKPPEPPKASPATEAASAKSGRKPRGDEPRPH